MNRPPPRSRPLYWRLLRLKHVHPNSWQRAVLGEGALAVGAILVLADLASLWVLVALPVTVAAVVKGHDLFAGLLAPVERPDLSGVESTADGPDGTDHVPASDPEHAPADSAVAQPATDDFDEQSMVRVIPAPSRRAAARPGAAAARAQVASRRPRGKVDR